MPEESSAERRESPPPTRGVAPPSRIDHFPQTACTHLGEMVEGDEDHGAELNHFVMTYYYRPLLCYVRAHRWARALEAEPEEIVAEFFAKRLENGDFLRKWWNLYRTKDYRLRYYLMRGMQYSISEQLQAQNKRPNGLPANHDDPEAHTEGARGFRREFARTLVEQALVECEDYCRRRFGHTRHVEVFRRHYLDGQTYPEIAGAFQLRGAGQASGWTRVVRERFVKVTRTILVGHGVPADNFEREISDLLEDLKP